VEIAINALLTVVGLAMLCFGGNWLVSGGVSIAKKLRISQMVIGLTVVAYGTSTPELAASVAAAVGLHTDLILGNIVGSNISNIGMVIGISAIISPLIVSKATTRKEIPIMIGVMLLLVAISVDGEFTKYEGVLLIAGLIAFTVYTLSRAKRAKARRGRSGSSKIICSTSIGVSCHWLWTSISWRISYNRKCNINCTRNWDI